MSGGGNSKRERLRVLRNSSPKHRGEILFFRTNCSFFTLIPNSDLDLENKCPM